MSSGRLIVVTLVRNESGRYWKSVLRAWSEFADKIIVLDDGSTDKTVKIADKFEKVCPYQRVGLNAWGAESAAREELWGIAMEESVPGDMLFWLDADMVPMADPREFISPNIDTYFFTLYDLWGEDAYGRLCYRDDKWWNAHSSPRIWMIRKPKSFDAQWSGRGLHCGHLPINWIANSPMFVPPSHALLHYGYHNEIDRAEKAAAYLRKVEHLSEKEQSHARSILDPAPFTRPLLTDFKWNLKRT